MKKFILVFVLMLTFISNTKAAWPVRTQIRVTPTYASGTVFNTWHRPVICHGSVFGRTRYGYVAEVWMNNIVLYPGQFAHEYVYTSPADPFIHAWANIQCDWLYY